MKGCMKMLNGIKMFLIVQRLVTMAAKTKKKLWLDNKLWQKLLR